jgi:hypothetical protein
MERRPTSTNGHTHFPFTSPCHICWLRQWKVTRAPATVALPADCRRGEASDKCVHTCELEVMRHLYDKKNISLQKDTVKLKKREAYFQNDKVAMAKQKLQEKESEMGISSDD